MPKAKEKVKKSSDFRTFYGGQYRTRTRLTVFESCFCMFCSSFLCRSALRCAIRWPVSFSRAFAVRLKIRLKSTARQMHCSDGFKMQVIAGARLRTSGKHSAPCMIRSQNTETVQSFIGGHVEKDLVFMT